MKDPERLSRIRFNEWIKEFWFNICH
jgi:hypothetical protein